MPEKGEKADKVYVREELDDCDIEVSAAACRTTTRITGSPSHFTTSYGSPEQALGEASNEAQDVYAIGSLIYDLLTGKPPFMRGDVLAQIREVVPPLMTERRRELGIKKAGLIPQRWRRRLLLAFRKIPKPGLGSMIYIKCFSKKKGP